MKSNTSKKLLVAILLAGGIFLLTTFKAGEGAKDVEIDTLKDLEQYF